VLGRRGERNCYRKIPGEPKDKVEIGYEKDSDIGIFLKENKSLIEKDTFVNIIEMKKRRFFFLKNQKNIKIDDKESILFLKVIN